MARRSRPPPRFSPSFPKSICGRVACFYRPGEGFFLADAFAARAIYRLVQYVTVALAIALPLV